MDLAGEITERALELVRAHIEAAAAHDREEAAARLLLELELEDAGKKVGYWSSSAAGWAYKLVLQKGGRDFRALDDHDCPTWISFWYLHSCRLPRRRRERRSRRRRRLARLQRVSAWYPAPQLCTLTLSKFQEASAQALSHCCR